MNYTEFLSFDILMLYKLFLQLMIRVYSAVDTNIAYVWHMQQFAL